MPEYRQNLATKEWIILATERAKRPEDFTRMRPPVKAVAAFEEKCPFCAGHEGETPPPLLVLPKNAPPGQWEVRVVPNKFPALASPDHDEPCLHCSTRVGPYLRREGVGHHEIVIETPQHNCELPLLSPQHVERVVQAYYQRYNALIQSPSTELVVIFRNHGEKAGTSIIHPHSQIVASSVVPFPVRNRLYEGQRYFDSYGRCVYCDIIEYESREGGRIIMENDYFVALAPFASGVPYEIWLLPKHHEAAFGSVEQEEVRDLARVLQNLLARLWRLLDDPDYNYVINTAPHHMSGVPFYHWHLEILPRLTTQAGFEIGSGIGINIVPPEQAAVELRDTDGAPLSLEEARGA